MDDRQSGDSENDEAPGQLGEHAAHAAGARLRELADEEAARVAAEEAAAEEAGLHKIDAAVALSPLAEYAEPCTPENLAALAERDAALADYVPCPFCVGYGAVVADELLERLPTVVEALSPFPQSHVFVRCDECDGWGRVLTGGRLGDNGIQPCPKCGSHGYVDLRERRSLVDVQREVGGVLVTAPPVAGDPFRIPPPEGVPPAAGMVWDDEAGQWAYPPAVTA